MPSRDLMIMFLVLAGGCLRGLCSGISMGQNWKALQPLTGGDLRARKVSLINLHTVAQAHT